MSAHTEELLTIEDNQKGVYQGTRLIALFYTDHGKRMVACYNALTGLNPSAVPGLVEILESSMVDIHGAVVAIRFGRADDAISTLDQRHNLIRTALADIKKAGK